MPLGYLGWKKKTSSSRSSSSLRLRGTGAITVHTLHKQIKQYHIYIYMYVFTQYYKSNKHLHVMYIFIMKEKESKDEIDTSNKTYLLFVSDYSASPTLLPSLLAHSVCLVVVVLRTSQFLLQSQYESLYRAMKSWLRTVLVQYERRRRLHRTYRAVVWVSLGRWTTSQS